MRNNSQRLLIGGSVIAICGLVASIPLNMGGCSAGNINIAGMVNAGGKAFKAASLDARHEKAIGESVSLAVTNDYGVTKNEQLAQYVVLVGQTVASRTARADQTWVFGVLDTQTVNAFSGPGGYVWVTQGAIDQMQDESELACVLAHEIGHVVKKHGLQAAQQAGFADAAVTAIQSSNNLNEFNGLSDKVVDIIVKQGFTQPQEFEADAEGVKYASAAGYDPNGLLHFLQRIRQKQQSGVPNLLSTHPGLDERIRRISNQISAAGTGGRGATLKERFDQYTGRAPAAASASGE